MSLTTERLRELLDYDPATGVFTWKARRRGVKEPGPAGCIRWDGRYRTIGVDRKCYSEHRLAWFYVFGEWPEREIDHINGDGCDNRIDNLRLASHAENMANRRIDHDSKSGLKGVSKTHSGKWKAQINKNGGQFYLGVFNSPEAAHLAYCKAARILSGEFAKTA